MLYCFICPECGYRVESTVRDPAPGCLSHDVFMRRDYQTERAGIGSGVRVSRDGTNRDQADIFLPTARELASPDDPDGSKGIKKWNDEHDPKPGNSAPVRPQGKKEVF